MHGRVPSRQDIAEFAALTGDRGAHHLTDSAIAHGLLVAAVRAELGGQLSFLGRAMRLEFLRPVHPFDGDCCGGHAAA